MQSPVGAGFPLTDYDPAPATAPWVDPESVLGDGRSLFYQHADPVVVQMVKSAGSVAVYW